MGHVMNKYLDDLLVLAGCALILIGVWTVCPVATWFAAGAMCIAGGVLLGLGGTRNDHS